MTSELHGKRELETVSPVSCNLSLFSESQRRRHAELGNFVLAEYVTVSELVDGFVLEFPNKPDSFLKISEWAALEHLCCSFMTFSLETGRDEGPIRMTIRGPNGTKELLKGAIHDARVVK